MYMSNNPQWVEMPLKSIHKQLSSSDTVCYISLYLDSLN